MRGEHRFVAHTHTHTVRSNVCTHIAHDVSTNMYDERSSNGERFTMQKLFGKKRVDYFLGGVLPTLRIFCPKVAIFSVLNINVTIDKTINFSVLNVNITFNK